VSGALEVILCVLDHAALVRADGREQAQVVPGAYEEIGRGRDLDAPRKRFEILDAPDLDSLDLAP
jgi:hypothetical protein